MNKLVILNKFSTSSFVWENLQRSKNTPEMSVEQIVSKFDGFEGDLVSISSCYEEDGTKKMIKTYTENEKTSYPLILYVCTNSRKINLSLDNKFSFVGYDFGICEEDATNYSSIFNEVLFGHVNELTSYIYALNDHFLFPNERVVQEYAKQHNLLLQEGKDVEHEDYMRIHEIFKYNK